MKLLKFEDRRLVISELAKRLDQGIEKVHKFDGDQCMRKMSPVVRQLIRGEPIPDRDLVYFALHVRSHTMAACEIDLIDATWGDFYTAVIWKSFGSLVASLFPDVSPEDVSHCLVKLTNGIVILEDAAANPRLFHLNVDQNQRCLDDESFRERNELALTIEPRSFELLRQMGGEEI